MSNSPWGPVTHTEQLGRGIAFIYTASHGGLRISRAKAKKILSSAALSRAIQTKDYFFFEEDCKFSIALWELPEVMSILNRRLGSPFPKITRESLLVNISQWNPDYLVEHGDTPAGVSHESIRQQRRQPS